MMALDEKISTINEYIKKLEEVISTNDCSEAKRLQNEIIGVYKSEIDSITDQLDNYKPSLGIERVKIDYLGDARILKAKLLNYKQNLSTGLIKVFKKGGGFSVTQNVTQEAATYVNVTFDNTVYLINNLPETVLSDDEKDTLNGKLSGINSEKDKSKRGERIISALKWIAEKGVEVAKVALPYILKVLEGQG